MYKNKKLNVLLISFMVLLSIAVIGTLAFLSDKTEKITNTFEPTEVPIEIWETNEGGSKKDVFIKNIGDIDAYIRAKVIINWLDSEGNVAAQRPTGYTLTEDYAENTGWIQYGGYWYYTGKVSSGGVTNVLLEECKFVTEESEPAYALQVDIIAQSIQAEPEQAIEDAWNLEVVRGADGVLTSISSKEETNQ